MAHCVGDPNQATSFTVETTSPLPTPLSRAMAPDFPASKKSGLNSILLDANKENAAALLSQPTTTNETLRGPALSIMTDKSAPAASTRRRVLLPSLNPQERRPLSITTTATTTTTTTTTKEENKYNNEQGGSSIVGDDSATNSSASTSTSTMNSLHTGLSDGKSRASAALEECTSNSITSNLSLPKSERVLRYGETVDSLFCLMDARSSGGSGGDSRHRRLCHEICSGERANDAGAWREALQCSLTSSSLAAAKEIVDIGKRMIQLHRRATSRFKLTIEKDTANHHEVLKIWLLYALVLLKYGESNNDARQTFKHIQRLSFSTRGKEFYASLIESDSGQEDLDEAVMLLKEAMSHGVQPMELLTNQIHKLEKNGHYLEQRIEAPVRLISLPSLSSKSQPVRNDNLQSTETKKYSSNEQHGPKTERTTDKQDKGHLISAPPAKFSEECEEKTNTRKRFIKLSLESSPGLTHSNIDSTKPPFRSALASRKKLRTDRTTPHPYGTRKSMREGGSLSALLSKSIDHAEEDDSEEDEKLPAKEKSTTSSDKRGNKEWLGGSMSTSAPDSAEARKHFEDISPIDPEGTNSIKDMDLGYLLSWDPSKRDTDKKQVSINDDKIREAKKPSMPKITRNDLGYMMNWDPFSNRQPKGDDSKKNPGMMSKIEEVTEVSITTGQGENAPTSHSRLSCSTQGSNEKRSNSPSKSRSSIDSSSSSDSQCSPPPNKEELTDKSSKSSSSKDTISTAKLDCSFLPLIEKKNIIRVENEPYAKLGVIGKGGSCKVYRALSADCEVVALKKVKLDGLNKAAIDGYANEIALLKRLKGNPAIIQLYSSEVDLERKSIFLVMEQGEVDLNYVLRQQELLSSQQGGRGRSSLNMNFIRLTWQQMLTAVHSIHEERIIHSDLKPANFLFVRGALKLIDFGIAKAIEKEDTTNVYRETLSGTLSYMSPEAIMDTSTNAKGVRVNKCGRASDIWSLGCILYQMVYGKTPFAHCHGIPQKVLAITNVNHIIDFPDDVDASAIDAMKLCLERNPKQRATIIGRNGLLNEHCFLHSRSRGNPNR